MSRSSENLAIAEAETIDPRDVLREAISKHEAAKQRVAAAREASDGWRHRRAEAEAAVEAAEEAMTAAQDTLADDEGQPIMSVRDARECLEDARDRLAAIERSKARLDDELRAAERALGLAELPVERAIADVVRPAVLKLLASHEVAQRRCAEHVGLISLFANAQCLPPDVRSWGTQSHINREFLAPWKAALLALRSDADAVLPEVGDGSRDKA